MSKRYSIEKRSDYGVLEWWAEYGTWREMISDLAYRLEHANEIFYGPRAKIYRNAEFVAYLDQLFAAGRPLSRLRLADVRAARAEIEAGRAEYEAACEAEIGDE